MEELRREAGGEQLQDAESDEQKQRSQGSERWLSISEFASLTGIAQSTLRYYDEIGLFRPARVSEANYRYYVPMQVTSVNLITVLTELGVPLKRIKKFVATRSPEKVLELLDAQEETIDRELRRLMESATIVHTIRNLVNIGLNSGDDSIEVKQLGETGIVLGPTNDFSSGRSFYPAYIEFCNQAAQRRINLRFPIGGYHSGSEGFFAAPGRPEKFFSIDPTGTEARAAGRYLVGTTRGYYGEFGDLPERMQSYAQKRKLAFSGPVYTVYLHDEVSVSDPALYLAQVCMKLRK